MDRSAPAPLRRWRPALLALAAAGALAGCTADPYGGGVRAGVGYAGDWGYGHAAPWWGRDALSVSVFYSSLSSHGHWAAHPGFGRVFVPRVAPGWQPYRLGHWSADPRWGRRWVSHEPFGWATYHYGRWALDPRLGWFWVPDTRFGPHWAHFRHGGGTLAWAPLPPIGWDRARWDPWGPGHWWAVAPYGRVYDRGLHRHYIHDPRAWHRLEPVRVAQPHPRQRAAEAEAARRAGLTPPGAGLPPQRRADGTPAGRPAWQARAGGERPEGRQQRRAERGERPEGWQQRRAERGERPEGWQQRRGERGEGAERPARQARAGGERPEGWQQRPAERAPAAAPPARAERAPAAAAPVRAEDSHPRSNWRGRAESGASPQEP